MPKTGTAFALAALLCLAGQARAGNECGPPEAGQDVVCTPRDDTLRGESTALRPLTLKPEPARTESLRPAGLLPACRLVLGILIAAALSCTAGLAEAQTATVTYVSNTGKGDHQFNRSATEFAQNFTTGSRDGGYLLTRVLLKFVGARTDPISVSVCGVNSNSQPTSTCTVLTPPGSFPGGREVTRVFTAPENTVLEADTTYALHIGQSVRKTLSVTRSNGEDSGRAAGWSIDDGHRYLSSGSWLTDDRSFQIALQHDFQRPTAADNTVTTLEDTPYAFGAGEFNFSGAETDDTLAGVTVVTLPGAGALTLDASPVTANQTVTRADIDAGKFAFAPAANANGDGYASFTFRVRDSNVASHGAYTMTVNVTPVADPATGKPVIVGHARAGTTLTAGAGDIADIDGLPASTFPTGYTFQWVRVDADGTSNSTAIATATSALYTPTSDDVGKRIRVKVSFTDGAQSAEALESVPTAVVVAADANDSTPPRVVSIVRQSPTSTPTNADSLTWRVRFGENVANVGSADFTVSGTTATASVSEVTASTVYDVTVSGGNLGSLDATVTLAFASGQDIQDAAGNALANTAPTLTNDHTFVVDNTVPTLDSGSVDGVSMVLTFSEALDVASVPGADAVTVRVTKHLRTTRAALARAGAVWLDGNVVTLTLASRVQVDGAVTLDYTPPTGAGASPLRDAAGNEVAQVRGQSIANPSRHGPPWRLRAVPGDTVVRLIWEDPVDGSPISNYEVRRAAGASVPEETPWVGRKAQQGDTVLALNLRNGTSYSFEVRAIDSQARGGATATVSATPAPIACDAPDLGERREVWSGTVSVGRIFGGLARSNFGSGWTNAGSGAVAAGNGPLARGCFARNPEVREAWAGHGVPLTFENAPIPIRDRCKADLAACAVGLLARIDPHGNPAHSGSTIWRSPAALRDDIACRGCVRIPCHRQSLHSDLATKAQNLSTKAGILHVANTNHPEVAGSNAPAESRFATPRSDSRTTPHPARRNAMEGMYVNEESGEVLATLNIPSSWSSDDPEDFTVHALLDEHLCKFLD